MFFMFFFVPLFDDDDELDKGLSVALRLFKRPSGCLMVRTMTMKGVIKSLVIVKALKARLPLSIDNGSLYFIRLWVNPRKSRRP